MEIYNKLVRDNIPNIIKKNGEVPNYDILDDETYKKLLDEKLTEELKEYHESDDIEELADLLEVIYAIVEYKNTTIEEFEKIRIAKQIKRGAFKDKIILKSVDKIE